MFDFFGLAEEVGGGDLEFFEVGFGVALGVVDLDVSFCGEEFVVVVGDCFLEVALRDGVEVVEEVCFVECSDFGLEVESVSGGELEGVAGGVEGVEEYGECAGLGVVGFGIDFGGLVVFGDPDVFVDFEVCDLSERVEKFEDSVA